MIRRVGALRRPFDPPARNDGYVASVTDSVQGSSSFDKLVHLQVSGVSATAREAVEKVGGSVTTVYYNKLGLRALLMPDWFEKKGRLLPRAARPHPKKKDHFDVTGSLPPNRELPASFTA